MCICMPVLPQAPEYCRVMTEAEVSRCQFDLIFAFDEVVALGMRVCACTYIRAHLFAQPWLFSPGLL